MQVVGGSTVTVGSFVGLQEPILSPCAKWSGTTSSPTVTKLMNISALAAGIVLVGAMTVINNANLALADESQEKVCEKHERVEDKHGFGSKQDHNFHEKHGYPEREDLGDLSGQEGDKDSLAQNC